MPQFEQILTVFFKNKRDEDDKATVGAQPVEAFTVEGGALIAQYDESTIGIFPLGELEYAMLTRSLVEGSGEDEADSGDGDGPEADAPVGEGGVVLPFKYEDKS